jgi:hypothetical protein
MCKNRMRSVFAKQSQIGMVEGDDRGLVAIFGDAGLSDLRGTVVRLVRSEVRRALVANLIGSFTPMPGRVTDLQAACAGFSHTARARLQGG